MPTARNINVTITVRDGATSKLRQVETQMKKMGKATEQMSNNFLKFNRTLFTTTAFIGTFVTAFRSISSALTQGADLDRVEKQFDRTFGPNTNIVKSIRKFTDTAVDEFEAMQKSLELKNLGLVGSSQEASKFLAMGAAAARKYGKDSSEGLKAVSEFLKTHDISYLQSIGVLNKANEAYLVQQGVLGAIGTPVNALIKSQGALNIGLKALSATVKDSMFGFRDLKDVLKDFSSSFSILRRRIGDFLGAAFSPMIERFTEFSQKLSENLKDLDKLNPELLAMAKIAGITTASVATLVATLGTLKLLSIALASTGFGLPKLISLLVFGGAAFKSITDSADSLNERLEVFSNFIKGVFQLITSFDKETGISKIDTELEEFLRKRGLLTLAENFARVTIVVKEFVSDVGATLIDWSKTAFSWISKLTNIVKSFFSVDFGPWSRSLIEGTDGVRGALIKLASAFLVYKGFKTIFGAFGGGGLLAKIPIIGRLFGGRGRFGGPSGSAGDPIHTKSVDGLSGAVAAGGLLNKLLPKNLGKTIKDLLTKSLKNGLVLKNILQPLATLGTVIKSNTIGLLTTLGTRLSSLLGIFTNFGGVVARVMSAVGGFSAILGAGALGYGVGSLIDKYGPTIQGTTDEGFKGGFLERMFFKGSKLAGNLIPGYESDAEKFIAAQEKMRSLGLTEVPAVTPQKSQVSTPYSLKDEIAKTDELGMAISDIKDKEERRKASSLAATFYQANSEGGIQITEGERLQIVTNRELLKEVKDMNSKISPKTFGPGISRRDQ